MSQPFFFRNGSEEIKYTYSDQVTGSASGGSATVHGKGLENLVMYPFFYFLSLKLEKISTIITG